jgi:hypothetical protein
MIELKGRFWIRRLSAICTGLRRKNEGTQTHIQTALYVRTCAGLGPLRVAISRVPFFRVAHRLEGNLVIKLIICTGSGWCRPRFLRL